MGQPNVYEHIAEPMSTNVRNLAELVRSLAGGRAKSLTLFGAIARGTFDATRHTARSVLVLDVVDLTVLRRLAEHGAKLGKQHIAAPLTMTPAYIKASRDTFALELIEIQQNHLVLFGDDYFADLTFAEPHVRLQCERELKTVLFRMRQGLLAAAGRDKMLAQLHGAAGEDLLRTLRGMLWLRGRRDAQPAAAVLDEVENFVARKLAGIRRALDPQAAGDWEEFQALYRDVEALGEVVDAW